MTLSAWNICRNDSINLRIVAIFWFIFCAACSFDTTIDDSPNTVHYYQFSLPGLKSIFAELKRQFQEKHPDIYIHIHTLPTNTDDQHQFYLTHLQSRKSAQMDVFAIDVIWMAEFVRAGLLLPVTDLYSKSEWESFFSPILKTTLFDNRRYAVPIFVDGGLLYSRMDLLRKYGFPSPPKTWEELVSIADTILKGENEDRLYGFVWQGRQYEGLICNFIEFLPANKEWLVASNRTLQVNRSAVVPTLTFIRSLLSHKSVSPMSVLGMSEEESRHVFQNGQSVFMRNWPYAWKLAQQTGSPIRGKVQVSPLPSWNSLEPGRGALGGFLLGINKDTPNPEPARQWVRFLTSEEVQIQIWEQLGLTPARKTVFSKIQGDMGMEMGVLMEVMENTTPRPLNPLYIPISQSMQAYISGALSGIYTLEEAMDRMDNDLRRITRILSYEN